MNEPGLRVLRMVKAAADVATAWRTYDNRHRGAAAISIAKRRSLIDQLIETTRNEIGELHLGHGPVAALAGADTHADDRRLGNRRIDHPHLSELVVQALRHAKGAAVRTDVFTEHEHLRVAPHLLDERFADRF